MLISMSSRTDWTKHQFIGQQRVCIKKKVLEIIKLNFNKILGYTFFIKKLHRTKVCSYNLEGK